MASCGVEVILEFLYASYVCRISAQSGGATSGNQGFLGVASIRDCDASEGELANPVDVTSDGKTASN